MKNFTKQTFRYSAMVVVLALGLMTTRSFATVDDNLDDKTTIFDQGDDGGYRYPLLGFYIDATGKDGYDKSEVSHEARSGCVAQVEGLEDLTPKTILEYPKNSCIQNDKPFYKIKKLTITGCSFQGKKNSLNKFPSVESLMQKFVLENLEIGFVSGTMLCQADFVASESQRFKVGGPCAVAKPSGYKLVNEKPVSSKEGLMILDMMFAESNNEFNKNLAQSKGVGSNPQFSAFIGIPLNIPGTHFLAYLLTDTASQDCDRLQSTNKSQK